MDNVNSFLKVFGDVTVANIVEFATAIGFIVFIIKILRDFFKKKLAQDSETTKNTTKILEATNRIPEIEEKVNALEKAQKETMDRIEYIEQENKRRECTALRERMIQSYRYYTDETHNPLKQVTRLEHQAFMDTFADYVAAGGDGYVKETLRPNFDQLGIVEMDDYDGITKLMHSRQ